MTLATLQSELTRHAATLHPLTETNLTALEVQGGKLVLTTDTSEMEEQIAELTATVERLEKDNENLREVIHAENQHRSEVADKIESIANSLRNS